MVTDNIEPIARAICERDLRAAPRSDESDIPARVDRCWPAVAAEIAAGLRDDAGNRIAHPVAVGIAAWQTWLDEHAK